MAEPRGRILIVDDREPDQELLRRILEPAGAVVSVYSAKEALLRLAEEPFDVVVTDQYMPRMTGHELVQKIKADPAIARVRCILLSGQMDDQPLIQILRNGQLFRYFDKLEAFAAEAGKEALRAAVRNAVEASLLETERAALNRRLAVQVEAVQAQYRLLRRLVSLRHPRAVLRAVVDSLAERVECQGAIGLVDLPSYRVGHWAAADPGKPPSEAKAAAWIEGACAVYTRLSGRPLDGVQFGDLPGDSSAPPPQFPEDDGESTLDEPAPVVPLALPVFVNRDLRGLLAVVRQDPLAKDEEELLSVWRDQLQDALTRVHTERLDEQRRLELMVETMTEGVVMTDEHGTVTLANPAARNLLALNDVERHDFSRVVAAMGLSSLDVLRQLGVGESKVAWREVQHGSAYLQVLFSHVRDQGGRFMGILTVIREVSAQKLAEQRREEFVHIIGHELRSPLTSIGGVLDLLGKQVLGELTARQRDYIDMAKDSCVRINHILNDLLDLAKFEQGKMPLTLEAVNLERVVLDNVRKFEPVALEKGVTLRSECLLEGLFFQADSHRLGQVMTNLLSNALKFTDEGRTVSVSVFTAYCAPDHYFVGVHNEGEEIEEDDLERVFEKFEQVSAPQDRRSIGGTGLGLSICRNIVNGHGGEIWVESGQGEGTTFVFSLPCHGPKAQGTSGEAPTPGPRDLSGQPILVVAADQQEAYGLKARLINLGFRVRICLIDPDAEQVAEEVTERMNQVDPALAVYLDVEGNVHAGVMDALASYNDLPVVGVFPPGTPPPSMVDMMLEVPPDSIVLGTTLNVVLARQQQRRRLRVLLVRQDSSWTAHAATRLEEAGYLSYVANSAGEALRRIDILLPDVVVLDLGLTGVHEVLDSVCSDSAGVPCLYLGGSEEEVVGLGGLPEDLLPEADALRLLPLRIRSRLNRERQAGVDALFMLPGAREIQREVQTRIREKQPFAYCAIDIRGLREGIEAFGFMWGHGAMVNTAELIQRILREHADDCAFLGHQREDDFVFVVAPDQAEAVGRELIRAFQQVEDVIVGQPDGPRLSLRITAIVDEDARFDRFSALQAELSRARVRPQRASLVIEREPVTSKGVAAAAPESA